MDRAWIQVTPSGSTRPSRRPASRPRGAAEGESQQRHAQAGPRVISRSCRARMGRAARCVWPDRVPRARDHPRVTLGAHLRRSACPPTRSRASEPRRPPYTSHMATSAHTVRLQPDAYELVMREAERRGLEPDELVDEIVRTDLRELKTADLEAALRRAAALRAELPRSTASRWHARHGPNSKNAALERRTRRQPARRPGARRRSRAGRRSEAAEMGGGRRSTPRSDADALRGRERARAPS